jgi:hypothetical protein
MNKSHPSGATEKETKHPTDIHCPDGVDKDFWEKYSARSAVLDKLFSGKRNEWTKGLDMNKKFIKLLYLISGLDKEQYLLWNSPRSYRFLSNEILRFCTHQKHPDFIEMLVDFDINQHLISEDLALEKLAVAMKSAKILDGIKIAEIGGTFTKTLFEKLGATVDAADAGYGDDLEFTSEDQIVNWENHTKFFPHFKQGYDLVCTNHVIDPSSGVGKAYSKGGFSTIELMKIQYALAKEGGAILNLGVECGYWGKGAVDEKADYDKYVAEHPKKLFPIGRGQPWTRNESQIGEETRIVLKRLISEK